eukprot:196604_1
MPKRKRKTAKKKKIGKRTVRQKERDMAQARKLGDRKVQYFKGERVIATVVPRTTLKYAVITSKREFKLGQLHPSKRHRIYYNLFKIYAKKGQNQTHYWDYKTHERVNKIYPDD